MEVKVLSTGIPHKSIPSSYIRPESDRPRLSEVSQIDNVPIIDLGCENRALIVEQIRHACSTFGFFKVIKQFWIIIDVMRNSVVAGCVRNRKYKEAFCVMAKMSPNAVALTRALAACSQDSDLWIGRIASARFLFDRIDQKTVVSWTSIIDAYGSHGYGLEALELFNGMGKVGTGVEDCFAHFLGAVKDSA